MEDIIPLENALMKKQEVRLRIVVTGTDKRLVRWFVYVCVWGGGVVGLWDHTPSSKNLMGKASNIK